MTQHRPGKRLPLARGERSRVALVRWVGYEHEEAFAVDVASAHGRPAAIEKRRPYAHSLFRLPPTAEVLHELKAFMDLTREPGQGITLGTSLMTSNDQQEQR